VPWLRGILFTFIDKRDRRYITRKATENKIPWPFCLFTVDAKSVKKDFVFIGFKAEVPGAHCALCALCGKNCFSGCLPYRKEMQNTGCGQ
jgi:hypothetical protein